MWLPIEVYKELIRELHKQSKLINLSLSRRIISPVRHEVWLSEDGKKGKHSKKQDCCLVSVPSDWGERASRTWRMQKETSNAARPKLHDSNTRHVDCVHCWGPEAKLGACTQQEPEAFLELTKDPKGGSSQG